MKLDLREDKYGKTKGIKNIRKASDEVLRDTIDTNSKSKEPARAEEKIIALQDDHENMRGRLNKLSVKLDEIQKTVDDNSRTVSIINKIVYAAVVAAVGAYVAHMWM